MKFRLEIDCDNAAFEDEGTASEVGRLLKLTASRIEDGQLDGALLDVNGTMVGSWGFYPDLFGKRGDGQ